MLSVPHLIVIFIVALVVFGPEKLPELARNLGKIMAEFRRVTGDMRSTFEGHLRDIEREADQRRATTPAAAAPAVAAVPAAIEQPEIASPTPAPGTVPSNPPNAAAIANVPEPERVPNPVVDPDTQRSYTQPGDPMHDPYLMGMDFPENEPPNGSGHADRPAERPADPAPQSERVTDGDSRVS
jgi:TatA/E family protein of Tat protein translocase